MEKEQKVKEPKVIQDPGRSLSFLARRFIAFLYNFFFVILFILIFCLAAVIAFGILALIITDVIDLLSMIIPIFFAISPVAAFVFISYKTSEGRKMPGNKRMGLVLVDTGGNYLSFTKSLVRNLLWIISALPLGVGIIWASFNRSGRGWHDLILGTRVVSVKEEAEVKIPKLAFVSFILGLLCLLVLIFPIATLAGIISSLEIMWASFLVLFGIIPLTFILGVISRTIARKKEKEIWGQKLGNFSIQIAVITAVLLILLGVYIPCNSNIHCIIQESKCEEEIKQIAEAVERHIWIKKSYPVKLSDVVESGYLTAIPEPRSGGEYIYKVQKDNNREYFVIECPKPETLLKEGGLSPPKKCLEIKYIQGKGLIVRTK